MILDAMFTCALFGDIGGGELLVVFAAILLLFGGKQLPSIARQMSHMLEELRKASQEFKNQLMNADKEADDLIGDPDDTSPAQPPPQPPGIAADSHTSPDIPPRKEPDHRDCAG